MKPVTQTRGGGPDAPFEQQGNARHGYVALYVYNEDIHHALPAGYWIGCSGI